MFGVDDGAWLQWGTRTIKGIEKLLPKVEKGVMCDRCGRDSHSRAQCYASTTVDGVRLLQKIGNTGRGNPHPQKYKISYR